jgi:hypothetical protein
MDAGKGSIRRGLRAARWSLPLVLVAAVVAPAASLAAPPYPNNSAQPRVQGSDPRQDGQTLTAYPGAWTPAPGTSLKPYVYRWIRCSAAGTGCVAIPGATGKSYTLGSADVGRRVKVQVTANCSAPAPLCQPMTRTSGLTGRVLPDPHNEGRPVVTGDPTVGQVLDGSAGIWRSPARLSYSYRWLRCDSGGGACSPITGATRSSYRLVGADAGRTLRLSVTASNGRPRRGAAASGRTPVIAGTAPRPRRRRGLRLLSPFPKIVLAGVVTPFGVTLSEFSIRGPRRTSVRIRCRGRGCPFRRRRARMRKRVLRVHSLERRLRAGIVLRVVVARRGYIGKYSIFRIRRNRAPARKDLCLRPGAHRPSRCPRRRR